MLVFKSDAKDATGEGRVPIRLFLRIDAPSVSLNNQDIPSALSTWSYHPQPGSRGFHAVPGQWHASSHPLTTEFLNKVPS